MNDFTWYSRLLAWIGILILFMESVSGRSLGLLTVLAVLALAVGLLGLVGGLALHGKSVVLPSEQPASELRQAPAADAAAIARPSASPKTAPVVGTGVDTGGETEVRRKESPSVGPSGAASLDVVAGDDLEGLTCFHCDLVLQAGQVAAVCARCHGQHHAACWVENHFHCSREGCPGHGHLQAPDHED